MEIYDNHGATFDRYTVIAGDAVYTMSDRPLSPSGVNLFVRDLLPRGEKYNPQPNETVADMNSIPREVYRATIARLESQIRDDH